MLKRQIELKTTFGEKLRYSKKTQYSGIIWGQILDRIGGYNSTWVIFESEL